MDADKKARIDAVLERYRSKVADLKKSRKAIIVGYKDALKEKRLEQLRKEIKEI